jgi:hypothetical protein
MPVDDPTSGDELVKMDIVADGPFPVNIKALSLHEMRGEDLNPRLAKVKEAAKEDEEYLLLKAMIMGDFQRKRRRCLCKFKNCGA